MLSLGGNCLGERGWQEIRAQAKSANLENVLQEIDEEEMDSDASSGFSTGLDSEV